MSISVTDALGGKMNRNVIVGATVFAIGTWWLLGSQYATTVPPSQTPRFYMVLTFGLLAVTISTLLKTQDIDGSAKWYGIVTSITCVLMIFLWLEQIPKIAVPFSIVALSLVFITYKELAKYIMNIEEF
jgi:hypothetical protein